MKENSYNNGDVTKIEDIPEEEREQAFKDFSEGDKSLKNALISCFESGITTNGCCKGHFINREDPYDNITGIKKEKRRMKVVNSKPYLQMKLDSENLYTFFNLIQSALDAREIEISLCTYENEERLVLRGKKLFQRKKLFDMISREVKSMRYYNEMSAICQKYWNLHNLIVSANIYCINIELCQGKDGRIYFTINNPQSDIVKILVDSGMKEIKGSNFAKYRYLAHPNEIISLFDKLYYEIYKIHPYNESNMNKIRSKPPKNKPLQHFEEKRTNMIERLRKFVIKKVTARVADEPKTINREIVNREK